MEENISGIPLEITDGLEEACKDLFLQYGCFDDIAGVSLIEANESGAYAFVDFPTQELAEHAIHTFHLTPVVFYVDGEKHPGKLVATQKRGRYFELKSKQ